MKRIVHLITRLDSIGGAQIHLLDLAKHTAEQGIEVEIWGGGEPTAPFTDSRFVVRRLPMLVRDLSPVKDFLALIQVGRMLAEHRPDALVIHSSKAGVLGRMAATFVGTPCVFTAHGWSFADGMPQPFRAFCWLFEFLVGTMGCPTITVSAYDRELGLRLQVGRDDRTFTIHNGVKDVPSHLRAQPADSTKIVMVARHCPQKDHGSLLLALARVQLPFELLLVGDGPDIEATRSLAKDLGLEKRTKVLGSRSDVNEILATAGVLVLASRWEGLPRAIIEGMRAGLPVVASAVGGAPELVRQNVNGYLVPASDVHALHDALLRLLSSPKLREDMGHESRRLFERMFRAEVLFGQTLRLIESAVLQRETLTI